MSKWASMPLASAIQYRKGFIRIDDLKSYRRCRVQLHAQGIVLRDAVSGAEIKTKKQQVCKAGDFLVAEIDAKVGGFGIVPNDLDGAIVSSHYFLFEIDQDKLDRRFLDFYIRTSAFRDQVAAQGSTNYAAIRSNDVLEYKIPLPPLPEQRRIVARIEALVEKIYEASRLRLDADVETEATLPSAFGSVFRELAKQHKPLLLGDLCSQVTDGPHKTPMYVPSGIPFVTVKNMVSGKLRFEGLQYISFDDHLEFSKRCKPEFGDVLYSKDGATRGKPCFVNTDRPFNIFVSVALIKPLRNRLGGEYLCHLLNSTWIKDLMLGQSRGDMIPHIVLGEIKKFPVPLPSLDEQREIVAYLDGLRAKVEALKKLQAQTAAELAALLPSVLDKAFKGEL